jgi:prevent-host-death family protein
MLSVPASEFRNQFAEMLNRVAYQRQRVLIERHGKPVAVLLPVEDLEYLRRPGTPLAPPAVPATRSDGSRSPADPTGDRS